MIKLVASDMDGTLLDQNQNVPEETYDLILQLRERGIAFTASSGRRYDTLCEFFRPVVDSIDFVAASGAQVYVQGHLADQETFSPAALRRLKRVVDVFDTLHLVVFDSVNAYELDDSFFYKPELDKDLPHPARVTDLPPADTAIIKASVYCEDSPMDMAYVLTRELEGDFIFAPSGRQWIDVMQRGVNKATGLRQVMDAYGIEPHEVMAFGDSMNDYEMLRMVGEGIAMENARYAIRQIADRVTGSNTDHSVQKELHDLIIQLDARSA
jgi:Cof subfamily protein (haloacid dehalogenase superfamily)